LETEGLKAVADFANQLRRALDLAGK